MNAIKKIFKRFLPFLCLIALGVAVVVIAKTVTPTPDPISSSLSQSESENGIITQETESRKPSEASSEIILSSETNNSDILSTSDITADISSDFPQTDATPEPSIPPITTEILPPPDGSPKKIAFTFDDGPHWEVTRLIADEFKKYNGKCTYFVVGNRIHGSQQSALAYAAELGHEIGIHGQTHTVFFDSCSEEAYQAEVQACARAIYNATGRTPYLLRPPGGSMTDIRVSGSEYSVILWNVDPRDWYYKKESAQNINTIVNNILAAASDGDIVLLHDIYYNTYEAVKLVLPILQEHGYEFVTVSELLGEHRAPGIKYRNAY